MALNFALMTLADADLDRGYRDAGSLDGDQPSAKAESGYLDVDGLEM